MEEITKKELTKILCDYATIKKVADSFFLEKLEEHFVPEGWWKKDAFNEFYVLWVEITLNKPDSITFYYKLEGDMCEKEISMDEFIEFSKNIKIEPTYCKETSMTEIIYDGLGKDTDN